MSPDVIDLLIASDLPFAWRMAWMGVMLLALAFILAGIWAVIEMVWEALPPMRVIFRSKVSAEYPNKADVDAAERSGAKHPSTETSRRDRSLFRDHADRSASLQGQKVQR